MIRYEEFQKHIDRIPVFDTHEHFLNENQVLLEEIDYFDLLIPYVCDDLISSGMKLKEWQYITNKSVDIEKRWDVYKNYHKFVQNGSYFMTIKKILAHYNINEINLENIKKVSAILALKRKKGYYKTTLEELNIVKVNLILKDYMLEKNNDNMLFSQIPTVSKFCPTSLDDIDQIMLYCGVYVDSLKKIKEAILVLFDIYKLNNIHAIKLGSAYVRELDFKEPDEKLAQIQLNEILNGKKCQLETKQIDCKYLDYESLKELDDFFIWNILHSAEMNGITVNIHTGIHAWNYNIPKRCKCDGLVKVISNFSNLKFVLLHCSYPFTEDALLLAKYYPNVYINLTWVCVIDRIKAKEIIKRIIEFIPINKVALFGGDCIHIENVYGHLAIVKELIIQALYEYIQDGILDTNQAIEIAEIFLGGREFI